MNKATTEANRVIGKYPLALTDRQTLEMPGTPIMRTVREVGGRIYLWAEVDPGEEKRPVDIQIVGTGHREITGGQYVGTAFVGPFVWHVYCSTSL